MESELYALNFEINACTNFFEISSFPGKQQNDKFQHLIQQNP
jgi:hypothetical protein